MILLDYHNIIIHDTLLARFLAEKPEALEMTIVDFDGVSYRLTTPVTKSKILLSMSWQCYPELVKYGAEDILKREYADYLTTPEAGFDVSLEFDLQNLPAELSDKGV